MVLTSTTSINFGISAHKKYDFIVLIKTNLKIDTRSETLKTGNNLGLGLFSTFLSAVNGMRGSFTDLCPHSTLWGASRHKTHTFNTQRQAIEWLNLKAVKHAALHPGHFCVKIDKTTNVNTVQQPFLKCV